jgi:hypothetical protein
VIEGEVVHACNIAREVTGMSRGGVTLHVLFFALCYVRLGTNGGGSDSASPCTPPMHAHTRTRIMHTRTRIMRITRICAHYARGNLTLLA